jgi:hypothetical protein
VLTKQINTSKQLQFEKTKQAVFKRNKEMRKQFTGMFMVVALSAVASVVHAGWYGQIKSDVDNSLCMAVKGVVSEGANVQLYKCADPSSDVNRNWWVSGVFDTVCQWVGPTAYCIDYRGGDVDAIVTKREAWKGNQRWAYSGDQRFRGNNNNCLDVNALEVGGPGQIKVSTCDDGKEYQKWIQ